jgi:hypothetical protein
MTEVSSLVLPVLHIDTAMDVCVLMLVFLSCNAIWTYR